MPKVYPRQLGKSWVAKYAAAAKRAAHLDECSKGIQGIPADTFILDDAMCDANSSLEQQKCQKQSGTSSSL